MLMVLIVCKFHILHVLSRILCLILPSVEDRIAVGMFGSILIFVSGLGGTVGSNAEKRVLGLVGEVGKVEEVLVEVGANSEMGVSVLTAVV